MPDWSSHGSVVQEQDRGGWYFRIQRWLPKNQDISILIHATDRRLHISNFDLPRTPHIPCFHLHSVPQPCPIGAYPGFNFQHPLLTNHGSLASYPSSAKPGIRSITSMCFAASLGRLRHVVEIWMEANSGLQAYVMILAVKSNAYDASSSRIEEYLT